MVKILTMLGFGVAIFAAAAGGSWLIQSQLQGGGAHAKTAGAHGEAAANTSGHESTTTEAPAAEAPSAHTGGHETSAAATGGGAHGHGEATTSTAVLKTPMPVQGILKSGQVDERMPLPIRPREMSVEELLRYGMGIKEREARVKQQEEALQKRRVQNQLAQADLEGERKEIDGLRVQVTDQLKEAERLIEKLKQARSQLLQDQEDATAHMQQIKHERVEIDEEHMDNTKRLSQWIQSMEAEKAAEVLKSMAQDGTEQLEIAVQILRNLEEREAAKILSAIDDPKLVQQLIEKFRNLKRTPPKTAAKR